LIDGGRENAIFVRVTFVFAADGITDIQITFSFVLDYSASSYASWCSGVEGDFADCFLADIKK